MKTVWINPQTFRPTRMVRTRERKRERESGNVHTFLHKILVPGLGSVASYKSPSFFSLSLPKEERGAPPLSPTQHAKDHLKGAHPAAAERFVVSATTTTTTSYTTHIATKTIEVLAKTNTALGQHKWAKEPLPFFSSSFDKC